MSKPWHGKIAALSLFYLIRDNMGERQGSSSRGEEGGLWRSGGGEVGRKARLEDRYKMGEKGMGWWEVESCSLWCCNMKGSV